MAERSRHEPGPGFGRVTDDQWRRLAGRRVFFGHQSVGENILEGVADMLAEHPHIGVRVSDAASLSTASSGLFHARVGHNGDPLSKSAALVRVADSARIDVAMVKYCYVDVTAQTNPDTLFHEYRRQMDELRSRHPDVVIVHVTMPLTTIGGFRERLSALRHGTSTSRDLNKIRNRYNALLRAACAGKEPVFDLAGIESTTSTGSRRYFGRDGNPVYYLNPEYSTDGGHLNAAGQRVAAEALLALLAAL